MRDMIRAFTGSIAGHTTGRQMHIEIEEITPPLINDVTDEFTGGGMPGQVAVPLGIQLTDARLKLTTWNATVLRRVAQGVGLRDTFTFRGAAKSEVDGTTKPVIIVMEGRLGEANPDTWTRGERSGIEFTISTIVYYKLVINDEEIYEIDFLNGIQKRGGVDELADTRSALGFD